MKTYYFRIICAMIFALSISGINRSALAQAPQKMSYQAVIRDANGSLIKSNNVGIRIQLLQYSEFGGSVYVETHQANTNVNGLVTLKIGEGTVLYGDFGKINWADGPYFIKTETDPAGGNNYSIVGTSELLSVPYALYSGSSMPEGSIIMYSGSWNFDASGLGTGTLDGWALCNGNNGTPNLTDKFVMGTNSSASLETTGGTNSYALTTNQLPSHTHGFITGNSGDHSHTINVNSGGSHAHTITINSDGQHSHTTYSDYWGIWHANDANYGLDVFEDNPGTRYFPANSTSPGNSTTSSAGFHSHSNTCSSAGSHSHTASCNTIGLHSHSGTTNGTGSGESIDNRPAFVKLAYIIKL
jgi:trimeric autotransporter adhesin